MGIATRFYLFLDDGSLRRIPQRIADELPHGTDAIPEFAGTEQRVLEALVESEGGKPARILDARGMIWSFDDKGRVDQSIRNVLHETMEVHEAARRARRMKVPDLRPEIRMRELKAKHEWTPTAEDLDRIAADIWPGINGPAPEIASVKGTKPRKPALTHEGCWALERIDKAIASISHELAGLSERALKGLAFEALRMGSQEDEALWHGVADEAKRREAIRAVYRTGKGEWIAVVDLTRTDPAAPHVLVHVASVHERRPTREAAIEAGRSMMAEKAEWLGPETYVEATIVSAMEWRADDD